MSWRAQMNDRGTITRYKDSDTGEVISAKEYDRRMLMQQSHYIAAPGTTLPQMTSNNGRVHLGPNGQVVGGEAPVQPHEAMQTLGAPQQIAPQAAPQPQPIATSPLVQPGAQLLTEGSNASSAAPSPAANNQASGVPANLRLEGSHQAAAPARGQAAPTTSTTQTLPPGQIGYKARGFLDATSIAILLPTLVLLAVIVAAAHKKRLFPWQTIRTFNPPSGLLSPKEYERSFLCPPNLRRHGRMGKRNPNATWAEQDGVVLPFGFLARTNLPVTIPLGRLPNKNMFIVAPSGSGKTTLMRAVIKALLAKPCVIIALEAKANDPNLDQKKEGFRHSILPEATKAGFDTLYFNPLDAESIHWNPLELDATSFASSIVQDVNSLSPEQQHWAERDHGYIAAMVNLLKWGAYMVVAKDENGVTVEVARIPCNPRGLMCLVNNRENITETIRRLKDNPDVDRYELSEATNNLSSIIRSDSDWDKNIQGIRGRLRMFRNKQILDVTDESNIDLASSMHKPTVLIFGAPASMGPDAESLASCFVYQLQQALHTRYGTNSVLPLFAFFDEYQTLNMDIAGRLSAIVRGANGGLAIILQNISQIAGKIGSDPTSSGGAELKTIFSNASIRVCLHNADESTAKFFSDEIGKHAVIVPGISDSFDGSSVFPRGWKRIHSQQVVARVDADSIKRMAKHHALVFLSQAADPEFGEIKPFMVDLGNIEDIARMHLLHNVSSRKGDALSAPPSDFSMGDVLSAAQDMPGAAAGAASSGMRQGPIINSQDVLSFASGVAVDTAIASRNSSNDFSVPVKEASVPVNAQDSRRDIVDQSAASAGQQTVSLSDRICGHCGGKAGKGRFCIGCGKPILQAEPSPVAVSEESALRDISSLSNDNSASLDQSVANSPAQEVPTQEISSKQVPDNSSSLNKGAMGSGLFADPMLSAASIESRRNTVSEDFSPGRKPLTSLTPDSLPVPGYEAESARPRPGRAPANHGQSGMATPRKTQAPSSVEF